MVKFPPRSQGRMPPQGSPFAAFSGTPSALFAKYGTKAAQTMIGSHNIHRPIVFFVFVAISSSPISRGRNATDIARRSFFPRRGPLASIRICKRCCDSPHHCAAIAINPDRPRAVAQCALRQPKLFGCTNGDRQASIVIVHPALPVIRRIRRSIDAAPGIIVARQSLRRPMILDLPKI